MKFLHSGYTHESMMHVIIYRADFTHYHVSSFSRFLTFTIVFLFRVFVILASEFVGLRVL